MPNQDTKRGQHDGPADNYSLYLEVEVMERLRARAIQLGRSVSALMNFAARRELGMPTKFDMTFREDQ